MNERKFVCVLKTGGDYTADHVLLLKKQVDTYLPSVTDFICYSDIDIPNIHCKPLESNYKSRWVMQEATREKGHAITTGLDTIFLKNCDWLYDIPVDNNTFYGIIPFLFEERYNYYKGVKFGNGITLWNGDWSHLFYDYLHKTPPPFNTLEMSWTYKKLIAAHADVRFLDDENLSVKSYKIDCKGKGKPDADILLFHGIPRPHECTEQWVKDLYYLK